MHRLIRSLAVAGALAVTAAACNPIFVDGKLTATAPAEYDHLDMTSVDLAWTEAVDVDEGDEIEGYTIYADGREVARTSADQTTCRLTSLDPGSDYEFSVEARSTDGTVSWRLYADFATSDPEARRTLAVAAGDREPIRYDDLDDRAEFRTRRAWRDDQLTYFLVNETGDLGSAAQAEAFDRAFAIWEHASSLTVERVFDREYADITIEFKAPGAPGYDFDGRFGTLAYAWFPEVGITAFDDAEEWSYLGSMDLVTVAAHEFGHALGIDHSEDPGALLAPFYVGARPWLSPDDIAAIRDLYPPSGCHATS